MRFSAFLAGVLLAAPFFCLAQSANPKTVMDSADFTLQVQDQQGNIVPISSENGWPKIRPAQGTTYAVHLANKTNERIAIAASIDGVDPFTGEKAYRGQPVRVLDPGKTLVIRQFRQGKSAQQALQLDPVRAVGSIDVISYRENMTYPHLLPWSAALQKTVGGEVRPGRRRGDLLWLPPSGAPFRKLSKEPSSSVHLEYGMSEVVHAR